MFPNSRSAFLIPVVSLALLAGCESGGIFGGDDDNDSRDRVSRRDRDDRVIGRDPDRDIDRDRDPIVVADRRDSDPVLDIDPDDRRGSGLDSIPRSAQRVDRGEGTDVLSFRADDDGTLYVYDRDDDRVLWSGPISRDERFMLDAENNEATINGRRILDRDLRVRHQFRLYFVPEDRVR